MTLEEIIDRVCFLLKEGRMILFYGAGVSSTGPSYLPLVSDYIESLLEVWCKDDFLKEIRNPLEKSMRSLRFERLMEIFFEHIYEKTFGLLDILTVSPPNIFHRFAARLMSRYGTRPIITTNFDTLIEKAYRREHTQYELAFDDLSARGVFDSESPVIFKVHGTLIANSRRRHDSIKVTIDRIWNGLGPNPDTEALLRKYVKNFGIIFIGYSCSDELTISPVFFSEAPHLKDIVIVAHSIEQTQPIIEDWRSVSSREAKDNIDRFLAGLRTGYKVSMNSKLFLSTLSRRLNLGLRLRRDDPSERKRRVQESVIKWFEKHGIILHVYQIVASIFRETGNIPLAGSCCRQVIRSMSKLLDNAVLSEVSSLTNIEKKTIESYKPTIQTILGRAHAALGDCHRVDGLYSESIEEIRLAIEILGRVQDTQGLAIAYGNLASTLLEDGKITEALEDAHKAVVFAHELGDDYVLGVSYINLGVTYARAGRYDKAMRYYKHAAEFPLGAISSLQLKTNLAVAHIRNGEFRKGADEAVDAYLGAMNIQELTLGVCRNIRLENALSSVLGPSSRGKQVA